MKYGFLAVLMCFCLTSEAQNSLGEAPGAICVGYRARKTMFLVKKVDIEGKSCEVRIAVEPKAERFDLKVEFPIKSLKSGDTGRDDDVSDRLGFAEHPEVKIEFLGVERDGVLNLAPGSELKLKGLLELRGRTIEIEPALRLDADRKKYLGEIATDYETFGLKVPAVAGGLVAKADPKLTLFFELDLAAVRARLNSVAEPIGGPQK